MGLGVMLQWVVVSFARPSKGKSFPHYAGLQPGEQKTPVKLHFLLHIHNLLKQVPLRHRNDLCVLYIYCSVLHTVLPAAVDPNGAVAVGGFVLVPKVKKYLTVKHKIMCVYCYVA